ncbi:DEAD/DEAH box helicase family protein, partial [Mucilaginibacter lappiensis]
MFKETIYKTLALGDRFNVAFPDKRIPNGYIDKTKTRIGITYTCFHDDRDSISIIPSVPIIEDALLNYPYLKLFEVKKKVTPEMIAEYLESDVQYKRIVTTPESFGKIISAAISIGKLQRLYETFFLYLDEAHCYASEAFRDDILIPFDYEHDYVYKFENMAMGTATSFQFSDPRIKNLSRYKMIYKEKFGKITIVNNYNPQAVMHQMLTNPDLFPGNVHIFFNSVTMIGQVIKVADISNVNIYCRDDERNMANLQDTSVFFKDRPREGEFQKFNFYSCRYNEGWDLKDDSTATIILLTDVRVPNSLIGIPFKGYQAV